MVRSAKDIVQTDENEEENKKKNKDWNGRYREVSIVSDEMMAHTTHPQLSHLSDACLNDSIQPPPAGHNCVLINRCHSH